MINISFDNPLYLLIAIPLLLFVVLPFAIVIRKDNRSKSAFISLALHIVMVVCITLAVAGTDVTATITQTSVYVVADVSHSASGNLDTVDRYIKTVEDELPRNSELGVVCFGKDQQVLTKLGGKLKSVKNAIVDTSGTDIAGALDYTSGLFGSDVIKRIVLITDGLETDGDTDDLVRAVENLHVLGVYVDVMYLDNNITDDTKEAQLTSVDYTEHTYSGREATANVLVQSNYETPAYLKVYKDGTLLEERAEKLVNGFNLFSVALDASEAGAFDYEIALQAEGDTSSYNNAYGFTQKVADTLKVLLVTQKEEDVAAVEELYGEKAEITSYRIEGEKFRCQKCKTIFEHTSEGDPKCTLCHNTNSDTLTQLQVSRAVPYRIEELCAYDEIVLSNVDVRILDNFTSFIDAVDKAVSLFGKSLVTLGDTKIQNKTDDVLMQLEDMLPVKFGNDASEPKLLGIIIDVSRSMDQAYRLRMAKSAAKQLLELLTPNDYVSLVYFSDQAKLEIETKSVAKKDEIADTIDNKLTVRQGTYSGAAMNIMRTHLKNEKANFGQMQVMLLSDGLDYTTEATYDPLTLASEMAKDGAAVSAINIGALEEGEDFLSSLVAAGGGKYYEVDDERELGELILSDVADDMTETVIEKTSAVHLRKTKDEVLNGISSLSAVNGFINNKAKASATTVLTVDYEKPSGGVNEIPLYAYWKYGNGKVSCFTSGVSGSWTEDFKDENGLRFFDNVLQTNAPEERIDRPYTLGVSFDGDGLNVEIVPTELSSSATVEVTLKAPDESVQTQTLALASTGYYCDLNAEGVGRYELTIAYAYGEAQTQSTVYYTVSYLPEYDAFATFDPSVLYAAVGNRGRVSEDGTVNLENDESEVATYTVHLVIPLLIATVVLYVVDIIVRKLKWEDIRGLFASNVKKEKGGKK